MRQTIATIVAVLAVNCFSPSGHADPILQTSGATLSTNNTYVPLDLGPSRLFHGYWGSGFTAFTNQFVGDSNVTFLTDGSGGTFDSYVLNLSLDTVVNASTAGSWFSFANIGNSDKTAAGYIGNFGGMTGYAAFRFTDVNDPAQYHYGWVEVTEAADASTYTLGSYVYDSTPGVAVTAGAVPEPSTWSMMLGGLGLLLLGQRIRSARKLRG